MAITTAYETPIEGAAVTSLTDPNVIPAGADRGMLALVAMVDNAVTDISSVVFNTSESLIVATDGTDVANIDGNTHATRVARPIILELEAPSAVDAALVATADQECTTLALVGVLLNGVHQTDMIGDVAAAIGTSTAPQVDITTTEADSLIVVFLIQFGAAATITALADTTQKVNDTVGSGSGIINYFAGERSEATPGTYTVGATISPSGTWACVAVEILNAAAGGGVTVTPAPAAAVGTKVDPAVQLGAISLTPSPLSAIGERVSPTVQLGSISLVPSPVSAVAEKVDPVVVLGSIVLAPAVAAAIGAVVDPLVQFGSLALTPAQASAIGAIVDPAVQISGGGETVTPAPAVGIGTVIAPAVVLGSIVVVPSPAGAVGERANPIVQLGSLVLTSTPAAGFGLTIDPAVVLGSVAIAPGPAGTIGVTIDPVVILGSVLVIPPPASAIGAISGPTVIVPITAVGLILAIVGARRPAGSVSARKPSATVSARKPGATVS